MGFYGLRRVKFECALSMLRSFCLESFKLSSFKNQLFASGYSLFISYYNDIFYQVDLTQLTLFDGMLFDKYTRRKENNNSYR